MLEIAPTAAVDDIKRAFRLQIARYHPDKVQHLGKEFQAMAADRAAELTEAYRILSDQGRRAEYDRSRSAASAKTPPSPPPAPSKPAESPAAPPPAPHEKAPPPSAGAGAATSYTPFTKERASRDEFVRKATIDRFKRSLASIGGYDESEVRGFDVACVPKPKLFGRPKGPPLLGRFVPRVDGDAVVDAWLQAGKWEVPSKEAICVFLMGPVIAPPRELADAIARQRRQPARGGKVILIPVDARDWDAHMPTDAPPIAKDLLAHLRGAR